MFYTYLWLREDGTPYYVGKGKGNRAYVNHRIGKAPLGRIVIYPAESEVDAFETEVALIWYYGRKDLGTGCLRNLTDGGDGVSGHRHSAESIKRMQEAYRPPITKEQRAKISLAGMGKHKFWKGKTFSAEHCAKIGEASRKSRPRGKAICHPEESHYCKGLCKACYNAQYFIEHPNRIPKVKQDQAACHTEKQVYCKGLCKICYNAKYARENPRGNRKRTQKIIA